MLMQAVARVEVEEVVEMDEDHMRGGEGSMGEEDMKGEEEVKEEDMRVEEDMREEEDHMRDGEEEVREEEDDSVMPPLPLTAPVSHITPPRSQPSLPQQLLCLQLYQLQLLSL